MATGEYAEMIARTTRCLKIPLATTARGGGRGGTCVPKPGGTASVAGWLIPRGRGLPTNQERHRSRPALDGLTCKDGA
jgi:hypothetical protein